MNKNSV